MNNKETLINHIEDKVPKLRFPEFTDPWEQRKLDTITDVRDGTHDSPQYVEIGHPFITSKNVKDGFINYEDIQYVSDKDYEEINKRSKVDKNDILMGMIGTIGNIALVRETPDFAIKNVALIKDIGDVYYRYLYHCLQSNSIAHQLDENLDGGTQKFIALNKIRELVIPVPSEREQHKIGDYMESLDNLITLHQRKLILLNKYKEGLYKTIFSNVSVESKVSLKDIIMPLKKTFHKSGDSKADGKYIFFTNTTSENFKYFDSYDYDEEIIIANTGGTANFKYYKGKFAAMSDCYIFKTSENTQYIYYWLDYMKDIIDRLGFRGNGIKHLDKRWFLSLTLELPSFTEQTKIVNLLNSFDSIIDKETQTLHQLQKMKSGLLQQMFI